MKQEKFKIPPCSTAAINPNPSDCNSLAILRLPDVKARVGMSEATLYRMIKAGHFPRQIQLGNRATGWLLHEVESWIRARVESSRQA
ncbi:MAG: AlpA family transcriptional regulator [Magnetococcales bacterium]|nr:AlpA family transcriptional regulator [Magnetococcales bacterium]